MKISFCILTVVVLFVLTGCSGADDISNYTPRRICPPSPSSVIQLPDYVFPDEIVFTTEFESYAVGTESITITLANAATDPRYELFADDPVIGLLRKTEGGWQHIRTRGMHEMFRGGERLPYGAYITLTLINGCFDWNRWLDEDGQFDIHSGTDNIFYTHDYVLAPGTYRLLLLHDVILTRWVNPAIEDDHFLCEDQRVLSNWSGAVWTEFVIKCSGADNVPGYTLRRTCPPRPSEIGELPAGAVWSPTPPNEIVFFTEFERYTVGTESITVTLTNAATGPGYKIVTENMRIGLLRKTEDGWLGGIWLQSVNDGFRDMDIRLSYGMSHTFTLINGCFDWNRGLDEHGRVERSIEPDNVFFTHDYVLTPGTYAILNPPRLSRTVGGK